MTYLALHGLGASAQAIERFATSYCKRLAPQASAGPALTADNWHLERGRSESYARLLAFFDTEIATQGWHSALGQYLPRLSAGAMGGALHPLIRLAFGIEFNSPPEIAAGLAFLACSADDARTDQASAREPSALEGSAYLKSWQKYRNSTFTKGPFGERCQRVLEAVRLQPAGGSPNISCAGLRRACLEAFHATHDFFALHLVTGSHAFRVCSPWMGPDSERLFSVGVATAYLAIGAPDFEPIQGGQAALPIQALQSATDEHDIKLAYACRAQALAYADSDYEWVAAQYLAPRLGSSAIGTA
jgi:hypothetical protein